MKKTDHRRYLKYSRKAASALRRGRGAERLLTLKWRYWYRLYGELECLWGKPVEMKRK